MLIVADNPGIPPIIRIVAFLGGEGQGILSLRPMVEVMTYCMHEDLRRLSLRRVIPVIGGVEGMISAFTLTDTSSIYKLILIFVSTSRNGNATIPIMNKVLSRRQVPPKRFTEWFRVPVIALMEEEELISLAEGHAVSEPGARELIIQLGHCNLSVEDRICRILSYIIV